MIIKIDDRQLTLSLFQLSIRPNKANKSKNQTKSIERKITFYERFNALVPELDLDRWSERRWIIQEVDAYELDRSRHCSESEQKHYILNYLGNQSIKKHYVSKH